MVRPRELPELSGEIRPINLLTKEHANLNAAFPRAAAAPYNVSSSA
jgi:hypothetical protein